VSVPPRVLILAADVGESHVRMARVLAGQLTGADPVCDPYVVDDFGVLGGALTRTVYRSARFHMVRLRLSYRVAYRLSMDISPVRSACLAGLARLGASTLLRSVIASRPDVVVSTYPLMTAVLGHLRGRGMLNVPVCAVVSPLGGLHFWVHPGVDRHLVLYEQAIDDVNRIAGRDSAVHVRPLVAEPFFQELSRADARSRLGLPAEGTVALVSGGGWGVGDLAGAIEETRAAGAGTVVIVTGRGVEARRVLEQRYGGCPDVRVLGLTEQMNELLAAADVFVTASVGLSCFEARLRGCPVICYGFDIAHVRDNSAALARHRLARSVRSRRDLAVAVETALAAARPPALDTSRLPTAAGVVAGLAAG